MNSTIKKVLMLALLSLTVIRFASAAGYYGRFWRGNKQKDLSHFSKYIPKQAQDNFQGLVNKWLIPATSSYAAKNTLMGYLPVLPGRKKSVLIHDEIALILYKDSKSYDSERATPEGKQYGPIHRDIFQIGPKESLLSSRSLVPQTFRGKVVLRNKRNAFKEVSYDLYGNRIDIPNTFGVFKTTLRKSKQSIANFVTRIERTLVYLKVKGKSVGLKAHYSLITPNYYLEYFFFKTPNHAKKLLMRLDKNGIKGKVLPLRSMRKTKKFPLSYKYLRYGQAGNMKFTPGVKPGQVVHPRLK